MAETVDVGKALRLPLYANRNGVPVAFQWTLLSMPNGSTAAIANPSGWVSASRKWQYAYPYGDVPTVTPDVAGTYSLQVVGALVLPDLAYPNDSTSNAVLTLTAQ